MLAGRIFKDAARPEVYLVGVDGTRRHIVNRAVYDGCGLGRVTPETWTTEQVNRVKSGKPLATAQECLAVLAVIRGARR